VVVEDDVDGDDDYDNISVAIVEKFQNLGAICLGMPLTFQGNTHPFFRSL